MPTPNDTAVPPIMIDPKMLGEIERLNNQQLSDPMDSKGRDGALIFKSCLDACADGITTASTADTLSKVSKNTGLLFDLVWPEYMKRQAAIRK